MVETVDSPTTDPFGDDDLLCPMGCGMYTDDPYGGPCSNCWKDAPRG